LQQRKLQNRTALDVVRQRFSWHQFHDEKVAVIDLPVREWLASDGARLLAISAEIEEAQGMVDLLYARWADLEEKQS
jgi:hypothetical protein